MTLRSFFLSIFDGVPKEEYELVQGVVYEYQAEAAKDLIKNKLEKDLTSRYPRIDKRYAGRHFEDTLVTVDPRIFLCSFDSKTQGISAKFIGKTDDEKALEALKYVRANTKYTSDKDVTKYDEHWNFCFETMSAKKGDCEDGSILLANLMLAAGIPYYKINVRAGWVKSGKGKAGHAYVTYYCEETGNDVVLDWCYWYSIIPIKKRKDIKDESNYLKSWFVFDQRYTYKPS